MHLEKIITLSILTVVLTACGGGGSDGDDAAATSPTPSLTHSLTPGDYLATSTSAADGCALGNEFKDGFEAPVSNTGDAFEIADKKFTRSGNELEGPTTRLVKDYNLTKGVDCVVRETETWLATVTAPDELDLSAMWEFDVISGSECTPDVAGTGADVPCTTEIGAHFVRQE